MKLHGYHIVAHAQTETHIARYTFVLLKLKRTLQSNVRTVFYVFWCVGVELII